MTAGVNNFHDAWILSNSLFVVSFKIREGRRRWFMWPRNNLDHEDGADYFWSLYRHWIINVWPRNGSRGMYSPRKVYFYREPLEERQTGVPGTCTIFIYNPCRMNFTICRRKRPRERERERERVERVFIQTTHRIDK